MVVIASYTHESTGPLRETQISARQPGGDTTRSQPATGVRTPSLVGCEGRQAVASRTGSGSVSGGERRAAPGDIPTVRLNARLNAASES